jgi:hypothetical protein
MQTIHLSIYFNIQLINSFSVIYKKIKMINITYMVSILNSIFTLVFYEMKNMITFCIRFEEILNPLNLFYICNLF